jgi:hypothetical protein
MNPTKEQMENAALSGYLDIKLAKWGGDEIAVRLRLPKIGELLQVLSPDILDEKARLKMFVASPENLNVDELTYEAETTLNDAIRAFFDRALLKAKERLTRDEDLGSALVEQVKALASVMAAWQQKLQPQQVAQEPKSSK